MTRWVWIFGDGLMERADGLLLRSRWPKRGYDVLRCPFDAAALSSVIETLRSDQPWHVADAVDATFPLGEKKP